RGTKRNYGWPDNAKFLVPEEVCEHFREGIGKRGREMRGKWTALFKQYHLIYPSLSQYVYLMQHHRLPDGWDADLPVFPADPRGMATRVSSGKALNSIALKVPWLMGGSADLAPSTKTTLTFEEAGDFSAEDHAGRNFHFGIREHAMAGILNGMSLAKIRPYGSTFLIFSDYARPAVRLAAMMEIPVIYVFTHDSIGVGEDGPTHQPVEQLASLRAVPGLITIRPADANEVVEAWRVIMQLRHGPAALVLTRQDLPTLDRTRYAPASGLARGAYVLAGAEDDRPDIILIASGSEVSLCIDVCEKLRPDGTKVRVVSMPSWELFEQQDREYRDSVLPPAVTKRIAVEQGAALGWERYAGPDGHIIAMHTFGASAPEKALRKKFGFTPEDIAVAARDMLKVNNDRSS
ncbi:MAG: transketolase, partial [Nitrospirota bacterium]|nr:transketolase [Nitrospirota bacterium]